MAASTTANSMQPDGAGAPLRSSTPMIAVYACILIAANTLRTPPLNPRPSGPNIKDSEKGGRGPDSQMTKLAHRTTKRPLAKIMKLPGVKKADSKVVAESAAPTQAAAIRKAKAQTRAEAAFVSRYQEASDRIDQVLEHQAKLGF